jgi:UDP-N-acetylmuramoylalanine--D-glutamate ligase
LKTNNKILVLGAGESGVGAALLAKAHGYCVFVSDRGLIKEKYKQELQNAQIEFEEGIHGRSILDGVDEIIKSPGIPDNAEIIVTAAKKGIRIISEIEFAARFTNAKLICITGSNGKTTTTALTGHLLKKGGMNACAAGNIGNSFAREVLSGNYDYYSLELSSFQLDGIVDFRADVAVLLNITPDHLDRYDYSFEKYARSKMRIALNQRPQDAFIWCADDEMTRKMVESTKLVQETYKISLLEKGHEGAWLEDETIVFNIKGEKFTMTIEELALQGKHNVYNSMAASIASRLVGLRKESIKESLSNFENIAHRLEFVGNVHGIEFINDSKATNVNSVWWALSEQSRPVIWIAGGINKGNDYTKLYEVVAHRVKALICLGTDNRHLIDAFTGVIPHIDEAGTAQEAVNKAYLLARDNDVVLLSPACASFDLFENYEDRGNQFKMAVKAL